MCGDLQHVRVDFGETFTPVVKLATIRTVLTVIASQQWWAHQLDVSNAFLHVHLTERIYCQQPAGFVDPERPDAMCLLERSLYSLRQDPQAWFNRFMEFIASLGFTQSQSYPSLFILRTPTGNAFLLLCVNDMAPFSISSALTYGDLVRASSSLKITTSRTY